MSLATLTPISIPFPSIWKNKSARQPVLGTSIEPTRTIKEISYPNTILANVQINIFGASRIFYRQQPCGLKVQARQPPSSRPSVTQQAQASNTNKPTNILTTINANYTSELNIYLSSMINKCSKLHVLLLKFRVHLPYFDSSAIFPYLRSNKNQQYGFVPINNPKY